METSARRRLFAQVAMLLAGMAVIVTALAVVQQEPLGAQAQQVPESVIPGFVGEIDGYWTAEMLRDAIPMDLRVAMPPGADVQSAESQLPPGARPGFALGAPPSSAAQLAAGQDAFGFQPQTSPPFVPPGSPADYGNYSPFQRWTWFGSYRTYPISTIGKLFFRQRGGNYVCSASVIARNTIATAGHCVHDGSNSSAGWSSNFVFCPGYTPGGCVRGSWGWGYAAVSGWWYSTGGVDRDYACVVTNQPGGLGPLGNLTGWTGRAWNWPTRQAEFAWGYPQAPPFPGWHIIADSSTEWYEVNMLGGDGQVSKYIGNDMTGGSSGGPWWLSLRHPNIAVEYPDTDGSSLTDPGQGGGPYINGVNSHKRCNQGGCPAGSIFTQEMGSAQFRNTAGDGDESEDVFSLCFNHGGV